MTPSRIAASVPDLAPDAAAALPPRRPLLLRGGAAFAAGAAVAALILVGRPDPPDTSADGVTAAIALVPWLLALPWLKKLDLRPVLWFFACLLCPLFSPVLAGRVVHRALSLPYRDWAIADWHLHRCRAVRAEQAVVLLPAEQVPNLPPREVVWRHVLTAGWTLVILLFGVVAAAQVAGVREPVAHALQLGWLATLGLISLGQLVGEFVLGWSERRSAETS